jgi:hypothetical protein
MTQEARDSARLAVARLKAGKRRGIIQEERLKRNLLSSQPLCFNLFGYLAAHRRALLPWVRSFAPDASSIDTVELEWAPESGALGGSAFDAFIEYRLRDDRVGFLGIECKYAEDLTKSQRSPAAQKYLTVTGPPTWRADSGRALDNHGLRQLWYNQVLTQAVAASPSYIRGTGVVLACQADSAARKAVDLVRGQLTEPTSLLFSSIESLVDSVLGHDPWKSQFHLRYLDFTPIQDLLAKDDPRRH